MDCTANDKGTLIDCDLGNPIQRDGEVSRTEFSLQLLFCPHVLLLPSSSVGYFLCDANNIGHLAEYKGCEYLSAASNVSDQRPALFIDH